MFTGYRFAGVAAIASAIGALISPLFAQETYQPQPGVEVQTRGPVHEAFAQAFDPVQGPGPVVPNPPPPVIRELPPEERPQGDNVQWISGYWSWDAERNDFVWVSGTFRNAPPGR